MKYTILARGFVLALIATIGSISPLSAQDVVPEEFSMALPDGYAAFTRQVQTAKSPEGEILTTNWISKAPTGEAVIVTVSRMPGKILDPQKLFSSTSSSLLKSLGATMEKDEPRAGDVPSSRLLFRSDGAFFRARFTVVDDRFYQLLYVGRSEEQRTAPAVGQIFESFKIAEAVATPTS